MRISKTEWEETQKRIADLESQVQSLLVDPKRVAKNISQSLQKVFQEHFSYEDRKA